ncbi:MAG: class I SAM-dependent methyltransferase [Pseudodesulfovibrio sp.]|uniref:Class I SAM-dependent methyltransferase n=2 Tax=Pseudodesulfovibrio aespoeensis TaxID=182210 RepID=E6VUH8_PSEA9|nr:MULTISPECIES: class I SAM-dependent methyltransferase [Pseudodesulfovibrio]ADU61123.1 hypothetical protein Daes_0095 [Pseudodesulfovibrio aespoeensis Aspo-2]MBU4379192.1 class I SAM-dependent methyltransferase [Pseudomonadota bacterium]MBV1764736.1 class I SAM-dependent methyltransferase [Pseudodesulfovibrio sp.]MBV1773529.1 class I SAM-dependent methyltransferase [Pseudodesulfovibrio sp.]MCG2733355.1 class I SAM-dependent methyltransferase [Pseudodesulfovibrio aespoeensis]
MHLKTNNSLTYPTKSRSHPPAASGFWPCSTPRTPSADTWLPKKASRFMLLAEYGPGEGAVVEIGSFLGKSTCWLALGAKAAGREAITAVDYFKPMTFMATSEDPMDQAIAKAGSTLPFFKEHIRTFGVEDFVSPIVTDSRSAAEAWDGRQIRLLFIDGHHEYNSVKTDFSLWSPFVQQGGIIIFHDYCQSWPGVIQFYDEMMSSTDGYRELFTCHSMKVVAKS